ncbi:MAG: hypothetical protein J6M18_00780 [Actinomycetaceae bacterium]|nr:hypothetical protein [Actinomycetaceae bacterium]
MKNKKQTAIFSSLTLGLALLAGGAVVALPTASQADDNTVASTSLSTFVPQTLHGTSVGMQYIEIISSETNTVVGKVTPAADGSWSFNVNGSMAYSFSGAGKLGASDVSIDLLNVTGTWKNAEYLIDTETNKRINKVNGQFTIGDTGYRTYRAYNSEGRLIGSYSINLNRKTPSDAATTPAQEATTPAATQELGDPVVLSISGTSTVKATDDYRRASIDCGDGPKSLTVADSKWTYTFDTPIKVEDLGKCSVVGSSFFPNGYSDGQGSILVDATSVQVKWEGATSIARTYATADKKNHVAASSRDVVNGDVIDTCVSYENTEKSGTCTIASGDKSVVVPGVKATAVSGISSGPVSPAADPTENTENPVAPADEEVVTPEPAQTTTAPAAVEEPVATTPAPVATTPANNALAQFGQVVKNFFTNLVQSLLSVFTNWLSSLF